MVILDDSSAVKHELQSIPRDYRQSPPRTGQRPSHAAWHRRITLPRISLLQRILLTLGLSLLVTIVVFAGREWILRLGEWGYLGAFLVNVASSATIMLPAPGAAVILVMGADFNPIILGIAGGLGSAVGELTGYMVGMTGYDTVSKNQYYARIGRFVRRYGGIIFLTFSMLPLAPLDIAGITAGATRYPVSKFLFYVALGKIVKFTLIAYAGAFSLEWVFYVPTILLAIFTILVFVIVRNTPGEAGFDDFDTGDASSGDDGPSKGALAVFKMMLTNPVILTIAVIEFCSGFLRQAIMQWYRTFAKQTGVADSFVYENWGMLLCVAGILMMAWFLMELIMAISSA